MQSDSEQRPPDPVRIGSFTRALGLVMALGMLTGCAARPKDDGLRPAQAAPEDSGLVSGQIYATTRSLQAATRGQRTSLLTGHPAETAEPAEPAGATVVRVTEIPGGTRIRVTGVRQENTITHGIVSWLEGEFLDGPLAGQIVSLGYRELPQVLRLVSQAR